jgi:pantoate--beta-alanine ligase
MIIFKLPDNLSKWIHQQKSLGNSIGFAPTMGALHEGHLSLISACKQHDNIAVSSIFVNPTQFNNVSDFDKYPTSLEQDILMLHHSGCDAVLVPQVAIMYPADEAKHLAFDLGNLEQILEGKYRPGHFQGVCQIVSKLLKIVQPDTLYLGQKDYQQCLVIQKLIRILGLNIQLRVVPTVREADGLAMSSRNRRLNPQQREKAVTIFETLQYMKHQLSVTPPEAIKQQARQRLTDAGFQVDYAEIADAEDLSSVTEINGPVVLLIAAYLDEIRLIDNIRSDS